MTLHALKISATASLFIMAAGAAAPAFAASGDLLIKAAGNYNVRAGNATVDFNIDGIGISAKPANDIGAQVSMALFLTDTIALEGVLGGGKLAFKSADGRSVMEGGTVIPAVGLQFYPAGSDKRLRPFIGAGAAYYKFYNVDPGEVLSNRPTTPSMPQHNDRITMDSKIVPVVHAGLDVAVSSSAFLTLEGRYAAATTKVNLATATLTTTRPIKIENIAISLGAGFRF